MSVKILGLLENSSQISLPLYNSKVSAGFPSPADDYIQKTLDLNEVMIKHPSATFLCEVEGMSLKDIGIYQGDLLVVDRSLEATHSDIVVCSVLNEFTVKELRLSPKPELVAHNPDYPNIALKDGVEFEVFGVVTSVIRQLK